MIKKHHQFYIINKTPYFDNTSFMAGPLSNCNSGEGFATFQLDLGGLAKTNVR